MVIFALGFCVGVITSICIAISWGHRLSIKEDEINREIIKEFQDKFLQNSEEKLYEKRYES